MSINNSLSSELLFMFNLILNGLLEDPHNILLLTLLKYKLARLENLRITSTFLIRDAYSHFLQPFSWPN